MDDFLHNLRSGKLKQQDRSNRPYNEQYKGGQRRPMMDRRKKDLDTKEFIERLAALKEVFENLAVTQKRAAEAHEARNLVEERKAYAMEVLAKNIYQMLNPNAENIDALFPPQSALVSSKKPLAEKESALAQEEEINTVLKGVDEASEITETTQQTMDPAPGAAEGAVADKPSHKLTPADREILYPVISRMREKGNSWERIARHIADQGYPTISGKGNWRGVMVKNLFEKISA